MDFDSNIRFTQRPVQGYQELPPRIQDYYQELQEWSSIDDETQERLVNNQDRRFLPRFDDRRELAEYKMKIDLPSYDGKRYRNFFRLAQEY